MRRTNAALDTPCPFAAFGFVIVNHTGDDGLRQLICTGANANSVTGNLIYHGKSARWTGAVKNKMKNPAA